MPDLLFRDFRMLRVGVDARRVDQRVALPGNGLNGGGFRDIAGRGNILPAQSVDEGTLTRVIESIKHDRWRPFIRCFVAYYLQLLHVFPVTNLLEEGFTLLQQVQNRLLVVVDQHSCHGGLTPF